MVTHKEKTLAELVRSDLPILQEQINGKPLVYFVELTPNEEFNLEQFRTLFSPGLFHSYFVRLEMNF